MSTSPSANLTFQIPNPAHYTVSMEDFKKVWATISADPGITLQEITDKTHIARSKVFAITKLIQQCGFIKRSKRGASTFTILIPYLEIATPNQEVT